MSTSIIYGMSQFYNFRIYCPPPPHIRTRDYLTFLPLNLPLSKVNLCLVEVIPWLRYLKLWANTESCSYDYWCHVKRPSDVNRTMVNWAVGWAPTLLNWSSRL